MSRHQSLKLSSDLVEQARNEATLFGRSISGQVEYWVRLGQSVESTPGFTLDRVRRALAGELEPGDLTAAELPYYDDSFLQQLIDPPLLTADQLAARGRRPGAVGLDEAGHLIERGEDDNGGLYRLVG